MVNAYEKYQQQSVMTMTQGEMLIRLFEELVTQLNRGIICLNNKDIAGSNKSLQKSQRILNYLRSTLNFDYDLSNNLAALYDFFAQQIVAANLKKEATLVEEILPLVVELKDAFAVSEKKVRTRQ